MRTKSKLIESIRVNRARLEYAVYKQDVDLMFRAQRLVAIQQAEFFDNETFGDYMYQVETKYLVFSEQHSDGKLLTAVQYRALYRAMSHEDRETHVAIEVDGAAETDVEQVLVGAAPKPPRETKVKALTVALPVGAMNTDLNKQVKKSS